MKRKHFFMVESIIAVAILVTIKAAFSMNVLPVAKVSDDRAEISKVESHVITPQLDQPRIKPKDVKPRRGRIEIVGIPRVVKKEEPQQPIPANEIQEPPPAEQETLACTTTITQGTAAPELDVKGKIVKASAQTKTRERKHSRKHRNAEEESIKERIRQTEPEMADLLIRISKCESGWNNFIGDADSRDIGWYQINKRWNPEVEHACAMDLECSTKWAAKEIRAGRLWKWNASRECWAK